MDKNLQIAIYRWEFLRRNEKYRNDWTTYFANPKAALAKKLLEEWYPWNFPQSKNFNKSWDEIKRITGTIWSKELEKEPFWPELKSLVLQNMWFVMMDKPQCLINPELLNDPMFVGNIVYTDEDTKAEEYYIRKGDDLKPLDRSNVPDEITITFTNFRNYLISKSKKQHEFRERAKQLVDQQLRLWESASKKMSDPKKRQKRFRFDYNDQNLKVWDLVQTHGENWPRISQILFPKHDSPESAIKTVKRSYKEANKLIHEAKDLFIEI